MRWNWSTRVQEESADADERRSIGWPTRPVKGPAEGEPGLQDIPLSGDAGLKLVIASISDVGCVRKNNEDSLGIFPSDDPTRGTLFVVADGMGGAAAGEVASHLAVETLGRAYFEGASGSTPGEALRTSLEAANSAIHSTAASDPAKGGMGTTCTACAVRGAELWLGHVGDSRAYLMTRGELQQVTRDHSLAAELERSGGGAAEVARVKNILTRCLGAEATVKVDASDEPIVLEDGMQLLICSDGLINLVEDGEILHQLSMHLPEGACRRLVDLAKERGAPDNVTVVAARIARA